MMNQKTIFVASGVLAALAVISGGLLVVAYGFEPPAWLLRAEVAAFAGESVLVAVLTARSVLRQHEFSDEPRAGFCLMAACQDCWVSLAGGRRVRACTIQVEPGMAIVINGANRG